MEKITSYKGFNRDWTCRDVRYEVGGTYTHGGEVKACESGYHACEYPLDVFGYYAPSKSRYAVVEQSGGLSRHGNDSKVASKKLTVRAEVDIAGLVRAAIEYTTSRAKPTKTSHSTGYQGAASSTGYQGAASSTGDYGAASSTGVRGAASSTGSYGAASSTGSYGAASSTGYQGAASSTGSYGAASSTGEHGVALAAGFDGRVMGAVGNAIIAVNRADDGSIRHIRAAVVGRDGIDPGVWYTLDASGEFQRVE